MNPIVDRPTWESPSHTMPFGTTYTEQEQAELTKSYEAALAPIKEYEVVPGTIIAISDRDVILDIGFKADGIVSLNEFRDLSEINIGDEVEVYVERQEDAKGQIILSRKKAKLVRAWEKIQSAFENNDVVEGLVKRRTKGGLIVDIYGIEAFLPGSQIDVTPVRDFDMYVGKTIDVAVVKINYTNDNVVVSHKILIEKSLESQKAEIIGNLEKGQVLEGIIKNMTSFGVFIDLGGVDGLLHITDIVWGRISHPEDVLELGQKVKVVVTDFNEAKQRISLGMKQLTPHPWETLSEDIVVGSKIKGKVVNLADYGAFIEVLPGVEGLLHVSEMSWSQYPKNIQSQIKIGDQVEAVILTLNREDKKMSLGVKQLTGDPWEQPNLLEKYAIDTRCQGIVRNMTHFGAFIELEEGIDGLLHVSDLSWTQKYNHPSEVLKTGETIEVVVLEMDRENKKIALGHKQLEESPWVAYEAAFQVGTVHQGEVIKKTDKGAMVALPDTAEGFAPKRHLVKEDEKEVVVGDKLAFKVIEFSKDSKKIIVSHTATFSEVEEHVSKATNKGSKRASGQTNNFIASEKSTLGDLEALTSLKEQIEDATKA